MLFTGRTVQKIRKRRKKHCDGNRIGENVKETIKETVRKHFLFLLLYVGTGIYYIWRMFAMAPWYDELYTYENFIDRGVIYSMIHWPLPNNHVFFSALSAAVNKLGSPYFGLRGISLLASMGAILLLYRLLLRMVRPAAACAGVGIFLAMYNVTLQAVQGRGYALSGFFLILGLTCLAKICLGEKKTGEKEPEKERWYLLFALSLTGGLYTIASNVYWVVPICAAGGIFLLFRKEWKKLIRLIWHAVGAAVVTFGLYTIIWLSIGSNFITKDETHPLYGTGHFYVLFHAPFDAFSRGMQAMLSDPNIQSISRSEFMEKSADFWEQVLNQVYQNSAPVLLALIVLSLVITGIYGVRFLAQASKKTGKDAALGFFAVYSFIMTAALPVIIFIQCVFPYLRVFTYMGSVLTILFVTAAVILLSFLFRKKQEGVPETGWVGRLPFFAMAASVAFLIFQWSRPAYYAGYDPRDNHIRAALDSLDETEVDTVLTGDVYTDLNLYFHIYKCRGKELTVDYETPDYVLIDKILTTPEGNQVIWPYTLYTDTLPWDWINSHMEVVFEDNAYIAYQVIE